MVSIFQHLFVNIFLGNNPYLSFLTGDNELSSTLFLMAYYIIKIDSPNSIIYNKYYKYVIR